MRLPERIVLLGHPVAHSMSPSFQNAAIRAAGLAARYEAVDVEPATFERTVDWVRRDRIAGNVTVPFKARMAAACDILSELAVRTSAVNTFWVDGADRLIGDNTDVAGFDALAVRLLGGRPRRITVGVLGAGGAAAAVLAAVECWSGCTARVYNRTPERARLLAERFGAVARAVDDVGMIAGSQLVVNATSIGLSDQALPLDPALIPADSKVLDLVYRHGGTPFVRALTARGVSALDGMEMLLEQGARAFERWFGLTPDRAVMRAALDSATL